MNVSPSERACVEQLRGWCNNAKEGPFGWCFVSLLVEVDRRDEIFISFVEWRRVSVKLLFAAQSAVVRQKSRHALPFFFAIILFQQADIA